MRITQHKPNGIELKFDNGLVLSTVWGYGTYSDNYDYGLGKIGIEKYGEPIKEGSTTVEIMFIDGDEKLIKRLCRKYGDGYNPIGYMEVEKWLEMISYLRKLKEPTV
jgi:hypothetical protein